MDTVKIVLFANGGYLLLVMILLPWKYSEYKDKIDSKDPDVSGPYMAYNPIVVTLIFTLLLVTFLRNGHIFNDYFPVMFIIQFSLQFLYLVCLFLPGKTWVFSVGSLTLPLIFGVAAFNGLFPLPRKFTPLELTIRQLNALSGDVEKFNSDLSDKMSAINKNMTAVIAEIRNRESELKRVNQIIEEKKSEVGELKSLVEIDERRAGEILRALNYHPPTWRDKLLDSGIAFIVGVLTTLFYERFLSKFLKHRSSS